MSTSFAALGVPDSISRALAAKGITAPFPIQAATIPLLLEGRYRLEERMMLRAVHLRAGQPLARLTLDGQMLPEEARYLYTHQGLERVEIPEAQAGDIIVLAGLQGIAIGETLADPLARSGQFPAMVTRMIGVGEKTGALEQMLQKVSDFYDSEVRAAVDALTSMIEPILILLMGIVVGGIVVALFMPILQLSGLVQQ